jgi:1-pyrroline-5-carboxylate dehydrogenase
MYGDITFKVAEQMRKPEVSDFFAKLIQRVSPKSYAQAYGEVAVTVHFLENFCGDQVQRQSADGSCTRCGHTAGLCSM